MPSLKRVVAGLCAAAVCVVLLPSLSETVNAQAPPPPALPSTPDQAPIDGGLSILALAGGAYAVKRLRNNKTK
jgi:hypothetical protein